MHKEAHWRKLLKDIGRRGQPKKCVLDLAACKVTALPVPEVIAIVRLGPGAVFVQWVGHETPVGLARRRDGIAKRVVRVGAHELAQVDVGHLLVTHNDQHVLVVLRARGKAETCGD